jgi:hypothetical protein
MDPKDDYSQDELDNRSNQLNSNNDEYYRSRGLDDDDDPNDDDDDDSDIDNDSEVDGGYSTSKDW